MLKRFSAIFALLFVLSLNIAFANCSFFTDNGDCEIFSDPYNDFDVFFTDEQDLDDYDAIIFNKNNPSNKIRLEQVDNTIRNVNPFTEPGVYVIRIVAKNKAQNVYFDEFEFIFDNRKPNSPVVPLSLISSEASITINGDSRSSNTVYALLQDGTQIETNPGVDGKFSLNLNLNPGVNYVKFYARNSNGIVSKPTERVIIFDQNYGYVEDAQGAINLNLNLQILNEDTIQTNTNEYLTSKRNFYITGNVGVGGAKVYANGNPTISAANGDFGVFVILNDGMNEIDLVSKDNRARINVEYTPVNYLFQAIRIPKISSSTDATIEVEVNLDLPFDVYLNGEFQGTQSTISGQANVPISGLRPGKNYVFILGLNSQSHSEIIYVDQENPTIELLSSTRLSNSERFYFEIKDDIGVDYSSVYVDIEGERYTGANIQIEGDIFSIDISDLGDGDHNYEIFAEDRVDNPDIESGNLNINENNVLIEGVEGARLLGNRLYVNSGQNTIILNPSDFVAFNSIYLDDTRITSYEIKSNSDVQIELDFEQETGEIELSFINFDRATFTQTLTYFTDDENPEVELDYIESSQTQPEGNIVITGKVSDSHFNWETFQLNNQDNFIRFGDHFEAYFDPEVVGTTTINIFGQDYSGNAMFPNAVNVHLDTSVSELSFIREEDSISGTVVNNENRIMNFLSSYDGTYTLQTPLNPTFDLAVHQRHGIRSVNMKGVESSGVRYSNIDIVAPGDPASLTNYPGNEDIPLLIYLTGNDFTTNTGQHFVQGQVISDSEILFVKTQDLYCIFDEYNFVCPVVLTEPSNNFTIYVGTKGNDSSDPVIDPVINDTNTTINTTNPCEDPLECVPDPIICPADPRCPDNPDCPGPDCPPVCPGPDPRCPVDEQCPDPNNPNCPDDPICPDPVNPQCVINPPPCPGPGCPPPICPDPNNPQCPDICTDPDGCDQPDCPDPGNLACEPVCPDPNEPRCVVCDSPGGCNPDCPDPNNPLCEPVCPGHPSCPGDGDGDGDGDNDDLTVQIIEILTKSGVYKISDQYFATVETMDMRANVSDEAAITLLIDGREVPIGEENGLFTVDVDLTDQVAGKNQDEIDLQLKAEDELGSEDRSNIVKVFYNRVINTIVEVFVG